MAKIPITIERSLKKYLSDLTQHYRLDRVILFGSLAQGTANPDSDIDLAIFSADATDENRLEIMADCWLKTMPYKLDIQPLIYTLSDYEADNDFIQKEIIACGIEIPIPE
jgi:predicted nucleotidyltransferase